MYDRQVGLIKSNIRLGNKEGLVKGKGCLERKDTVEEGTQHYLGLEIVEVCVLHDAWACLFSHLFYQPKHKNLRKYVAWQRTWKVG